MIKNKGTVLWALTALAMSAIITVEYWSEGSVSSWLIFVWLYNINFLIYSICNDGKLILFESDRVHNSKFSEFHFSISLVRLLMIIGLVLLELAELVNTYIYVLVLTVIVVDSVMMIFRRSMNKLNNKSVK